jgi:hypothetical protein
MLEEHPQPSSPAVRQPPQGRRAALASIVGHGVALALLTFVGVRSTLPTGESPLILAELVTSLEPSTVPTAPAEEAAPADVALAVEELAPEEPEPPAPAPPAPEPEPRAEQVAENPAPAPAVPSPVETERVPAEEPDAAERFAGVDEPAAAPPAEEPATVADAGPLTSGPTRALEKHEEDAVRSQLSSWTGRLDADEPAPTMTWRDDGQAYTAVLRRIPAADSMGMEALAVELTTERGGERLVTELRMSRLAFSNFGQFVNRWDPNVSLHDDIIDGRFHSNSELAIGRSGRKTPEFRGKVTIAGAGYTTGDGPGFISRSKLFPAGIETRTRRIALPERGAALDAVVTPDNSETFARDTALTFHADGTVSWRDLGASAPAAQRSLGDEPFYLVAADDVDLEVSGIVNGKVLVYSPQRIVITDDLRYAADPREPHADDYLGLVAERTVEIAEPEVTGRGDLEVFASIYARQSFVIRDFNSHRSGTLVVHGSLTAGTLTASEPRYATRVEFDKRLTTMRAPGFPLSDRYELDSTSGAWRVVGDDVN